MMSKLSFAPPKIVSHHPVKFGRGLSSSTALAITVVLGAIVLFSSVLAGQRYAAYRLNIRERLVGGTLAVSVDNILHQARTRRQADLAGLVGRPCSEIRDSLAAAQADVRYTRAVALVTDGRVYCSSALGAIDVPLSIYAAPTAAGTSIRLLPHTPFQPHIPVIAIFDRTGDRRGILYIVDGAYIADALAQAVELDVKAMLSLDGMGVIDDQGTFSTSAPAHAVRVGSHQWPFSIQVLPSGRLVSHMYRKHTVLFGAFGVLLDALLAAAYLLAFAPRRLLLNAVRRALRRGELHVAYQPIVDSHSGCMVGVEALLRWEHPSWGAISPAVFMREVETSALLPAVTGFVLHTAVAEMSRHLPARPFYIAINVVPRDLHRKQFVAEVLAAASRLPSGTSLVLELTERFLLEDSPEISAVFVTLRAHGIRFAIDDFGTEHSNLDVLSRFPFDFVKIDRQFVIQAAVDGCQLIKGFVAVANHFGLKLIAEGVETAEQHQALLKAGVPYAQGYLFQKPLRAERFAKSQKAAGQP